LAQQEVTFIERSINAACIWRRAESQAWESHSRIPHVQTSYGCDLHDFLPGPLANNEIAERSHRSVKLALGKSFRKLLDGKTARRIPSWPGVFHSNKGHIYTFAQVNLSLTFRLQQGGGIIRSDQETIYG
jgi:hypothetical protein